METQVHLERLENGGAVVTIALDAGSSPPSDQMGPAAVRELLRKARQRLEDAIDAEALAHLRSIAKAGTASVMWHPNPEE